jgi:hypothetical protein
MRQSSRRKIREQTGQEQRRFPGTRRRDHHQWAASGKGVTKSLNHFGRQPVPAEEPLGLPGSECSETWIRTLIRYFGFPYAPIAMNTVAKVKMHVTASLEHTGSICGLSL